MTLLDDVPFDYLPLCHKSSTIVINPYMAVYFPILLHLNGFLLEKWVLQNPQNLYTSFLNSIFKQSKIDNYTILLFLEFLQIWSLRRIYDLGIDKKNMNDIQRILESDNTTLSNMLIDFVRGNNKVRDVMIKKTIERGILSNEYISALRISVPSLCVK